MVGCLCNLAWFCGKDIWIDLFSAITLLLLAFFSFRYYRMSRKNKKNLLLAFAFAFIALGFLFNILTNFGVYTQVLETHYIGSIKIVDRSYRLSPILQTIGYLVYRFLVLIGLYALFNVKADNSKATHIIVVLLIFLSTFFARQAYYVFHLSALLFLLFITHQYFVSYRRTKNRNTLFLYSGFWAITFSQIIFMFAGFSSIVFLVAELVQFLGYFLLLITLIRILYYGKKKK
jgi:hypothetical protein